MNFSIASLIRPSKAEPARVRHARPAQAPQPPHAAPALSPTEVLAGGYHYQFDWAAYFRRKAADKRAEADDLNTRIQDAIGWASRYCAEADEMERMASLVELDQETTLLPDGLPAPDGLAMATDQLFNGWQTGPEAAVADWDAPLPEPQSSPVAQTLTMPVTGGVL